MDHYEADYVHALRASARSLEAAWELARRALGSYERGEYAEARDLADRAAEKQPYWEVVRDTLAALCAYQVRARRRERQAHRGDTGKATSMDISRAADRLNFVHNLRIGSRINPTPRTAHCTQPRDLAGNPAWARLWCRRYALGSTSAPRVVKCAQPRDRWGYPVWARLWCRRLAWLSLGIPRVVNRKQPRDRYGNAAWAYHYCMQYAWRHRIAGRNRVATILDGDGVDRAAVALTSTRALQVLRREQRTCPCCGELADLVSSPGGWTCTDCVGETQWD